MLKKHIVLIAAGFVVWLISNILFYPTIINLIFEKGYPVYIDDIYLFCLFLIIGFFIGWFGKYKGWLLGLTLGILIAIFYIFTTSITNLLEEEIQRMGYAKAIIKIAFVYAIYTIYLIVGGEIGSRAKQKLSRRNIGDGLA